MPGIADIRHYLNDMAADRVSDDVVSYHLQRVSSRVRREASSSALASDIEEAIIACTGYAVYLAYASNIERMAGSRLPPAVEDNLRRYRAECMYWSMVIGGMTASVSLGDVQGKMAMPYSGYDRDHEPGARTRA